MIGPTETQDDSLPFEVVERWLDEIKKYDKTGDESLEVTHD